MVLQPLPRSFVFDFLHSAVGNFVFSAQGCHFFTTRKAFSNFFNFFRGVFNFVVKNLTFKYPFSMQFTLRRSFGVEHVLSVLFHGAFIKMKRINAGGIMAFMKGTHSKTNVSTQFENQGQSVGRDSFTIHTYLSIAMRIFRTSPFNTLHNTSPNTSVGGCQ